LWNRVGDNAVSEQKHTLLPVLVVLFLISYGLLTMLVVEQGRTIDSQRGLIGVLFDDSIQLNNLKGKAFQKQQAQARAQAQAQSQMKAPPAQATPRGSQVQTPSPQATPQADGKNHGTSKLRRPLPQKPPRSTSDEGDERRTLISI
jgi:pyruvate/2-oxoglutarate dehydrogenase complex dihydrolipoamide acyltransferase (E2) component